MKQSCESECFDNLPQLTGSVSEGNGAGGGGGQRGLDRLELLGEGELKV